MSSLPPSCAGASRDGDGDAQEGGTEELCPRRAPGCQDQTWAGDSQGALWAGVPCSSSLGAVGAEREMLARATWGSLGWGTAALELLGWKSSASCRECWRIPSGEVPVRKSPLDGAWRGLGAACARVASHGFLER